MIYLNSSTNLEVVLDTAVASNQLTCYASWRDTQVGELTPGFTSTDTNDTTPVNLVAAPAVGYMRGIDFITIHNDDSSSAYVSISVGARLLYRVNLAPDENLQWTDSGGFVVISAAGTVKSSINQIAGSADLGFNIVVLNSDVVNNNAVANTIEDVTGLSFAITSGKLYHFEFFCYYASASGATGSRWAVNASAGTAGGLVMSSEYTAGATTTTRNANVLAFDSPATANTSSGSTTRNLARMRGMILADADAVLIARFASEVASSAITCKAGSFVVYREIV